MKPLQHPFVPGILNELPLKEMMCLLFPSKHMSLLSTRRASMIISRVRLIAALFAVFTVFFIIPDLIILPWPLSGQLAICRIITGIAFALLAFSFSGSTHIRDAYIALGIMFAIPTMFFISSYFLISLENFNEMSDFIRATYAFLPLVMVAGLSMFPLTAIEGAIYAAPILIIEIVAGYTGVEALSLSPMINSAWLVILIAFVAILSSMSQLGFMIALVKMAIRDALTGCFSRMSGMELLEIQYIISTRNGSPLSLAYIDVENFKDINDSFGQEAGDHILVAASNQIRTSLRMGDMLSRWKGEEFILIMPNTHGKEAAVAIDRLRANGFGIRPDHKPVTASIGISERIEDKTGDWKTLLEIADKRKLTAKQRGENQVVFVSA